MSFAIFDEKFYLENNPDVQAAVAAGAFRSGLQHFEQHGLAEGRDLVSLAYNEQLYLQKYPDIAKAVADGDFSSGLQHYIQFGEAEGRSPGAFDEQAYLVRYPDVAAAVAAGAFSSGLQHYIQFGQFDPDRAGYFTGTTGNDTITGFGESNVIAGVYVEEAVIPVLTKDTGTYIEAISSLGVGEVDTLIGGAGIDSFQLGASYLGGLYVGNGSADYALIRNFEPDIDEILLAGSSSREYNFQAVNGNLNISTLSGDLVGIVEGVTFLSEVTSDIPGGFFLE